MRNLIAGVVLGAAVLVPIGTAVAASASTPVTVAGIAAKKADVTTDARKFNVQGVPYVAGNKLKPKPTVTGAVGPRMPHNIQIVGPRMPH